MFEAELRIPSGGVAMTAIGVALIRARESERADRLYDDPLARVFVDAARAAFAETESGARRWAGMESLAGAFQEGRSLSVRVVDDQIAAGIESGCRQVVLIGAGLDTRPYRMRLAADIRWYEVDLPELFAFKEPLLAAVDATPRCARRVIARDLRGDWASALGGQDFRRDAPTLWVDEGVLVYLDRADAQRVAATVTELSAPGSRFGVGRFQTAAADPHYRELRRLVRAGEGADRPRGLGPQAQDWLREHGWHTEFRCWDDLVAPYGRPFASNREVGHILAIRR